MANKRSSPKGSSKDLQHGGGRPFSKNVLTVSPLFVRQGRGTDEVLLGNHFGDDSEEDQLGESCDGA
jgi:hypothetical protein